MFKEYKNKLKNALNDLKNKKTFYKQIPNILTLSRVIAPFIIIPLALTGNVLPAVIAASLIATTDFFDGFIARKLNITSELGRELDALSDKIFALSLIIPLAIKIPLFFINIGLECLIGMTNFRAKLKNTNPKTIFIGKVKTFALSTTIILGYLNSFITLNPIILSSAITSTFILQTFTVSNYIKINLKKEIDLYVNKNNIKIENNEINNNEKVITKSKVDKVNSQQEKHTYINIINTDEKQKTFKKTLKKPRI